MDNLNDALNRICEIGSAEISGDNHARIKAERMHHIALCALGKEINNPDEDMKHIPEIYKQTMIIPIPGTEWIRIPGSLAEKYKEPEKVKIHRITIDRDNIIQISYGTKGFSSGWPLSFFLENYKI